jgi:hypothetical protein
MITEILQEIYEAAAEFIKGLLEGVMEDKQKEAFKLLQPFAMQVADRMAELGVPELPFDEIAVINMRATEMLADAGLLTATSIKPGDRDPHEKR